MQTQNGRLKTGFTLIEMLVVVVIILILLGVVFRMVRSAGDRSAEAVTVARLSKLKAAVEEFYAEYGLYPPVPYYKNVTGGGGRYLDQDAGTAIKPGTSTPWGADALVQPVRYEYVWSGGLRSDMSGILRDQPWDQAPAFIFGMMSFLVPRFQGRVELAYNDGLSSMIELKQWTAHTQLATDPTTGNPIDAERDRQACQRWAPYLAGVIDEHQLSGRTVGGNASRSYTNVFASAYDGWEREYIYVSPPPHQSYLLFSKGRDGQYDFNNPNDRASAKNKDNLYSDGY